MRLEYDTYESARQDFKWSERWEIFDGHREHFNIAHECIDRHPKQKTALRIQLSSGSREEHTFGHLSDLTSKFAHFLENRRVKAKDRIAVVLNPSIEFYVSLIGAPKANVTVVPCSPLLGSDAIKYRLRNSNAKMLITTSDRIHVGKGIVPNLVPAEELLDLIGSESNSFVPATSADDIAVMQFSSGTTGAPKAIPYSHASLTLVAVVMKFGLGLLNGDRFFCPSSPAWGHGIWYGCFGPLALGNAVGAYSGRFDAEILLEGLSKFGVTNLSATPAVYRLIMKSARLDDEKFRFRYLTYTGGPISPDVLAYFATKTGCVPRSLYGSTEVGVILLDYCFPDWLVKPGSMGKPMLGLKVSVIGENGRELPPGQIGAVAVWRNRKWIRLGDAAVVDNDGYFWFKGRIDDVIKSSGYTIGPIEVEEVLIKHPAVREAAVIGVADPERGQAVKAFVVTEHERSPELVRELQDFVKQRLGLYAYPRHIEFIQEIPKTPDGKTMRSKLR